MMWNDFVSPMLLEEQKAAFNDKNYLFEFKFDGYRSIIYVSPTSIKIMSRNGNNLTNLFPELVSLCKNVHEKVIFDGELVSIVDGKVNFSSLEQRAKLKGMQTIKKKSIENPICFVAFDCLYHNTWLLDKRLIERKKILNTYADTDYFYKAQYILNEGKKLFQIVKKNNLEGIVAKKIDSLYYPGVRTSDWIKIKNTKKEHFYIGGYKESERSNVVSLYLCQKQNKQFNYVGKVMMGRKKELYSKLKKMPIIQKSPFFDFFEKDIKYIKPSLEVVIEYLEKNNHLRHPVFIEEYKKGGKK